MRHEFVEHIPEVLDQDVVYVSLKFGTVVHKCACGCSNEVVTPLTPTDWVLTFDGESISLYPSIGNWGFACKSHYWIRKGQVLWAEEWSEAKIAASRASDRRDKERFYAARTDASQSSSVPANVDGREPGKTGFWAALKHWLTD